MTRSGTADGAVPDLADVEQLASRNNHLAVVATRRGDGSIQSSLVNAGVTRHPTTAALRVGFVTYGAVKLANLRARPACTLTFCQGWQWVTVEGPAQLIGPDDPASGVDADGLRRLLRQIFADAGGAHDDWAAYDQQMTRQRRAAALVTPQRIYSNAG
jgi:PPOX class probable F420-dependent enzyme